MPRKHNLEAPVKRICIVCGKEFETWLPQSRICSDACRRKKKAQDVKACKVRKAKNIVIERRCKNCGADLRGAQNQIFCCNQCKYEYRKKMLHESGVQARESSIEYFPCKIRITKHMDVFPEFRLEVGKVYDAEYWNHQVGVLLPVVVRGVGKYGVTVRDDEYEFVE